MTILSIIFLAAVVIVGVVMAASGASSESFVALVLLGAGILVLMMGFRYHKKPGFKNAAGEDQAVGRGTVVFLFAIAALPIVGGPFVLFHGLQ